MDWREGLIDGVSFTQLRAHADQRGSLIELFRSDELPCGPELRAEMGYASFTKQGVQRGPHEHRRQTDMFVFCDEFTVYLWDARTSSPTHGVRMIIRTTATLTRVVVPPGVVHAYVSEGTNGLCLNFPNRLYKGYHKNDPVDEIRHEDDKESPYAPW